MPTYAESLTAAKEAANDLYNCTSDINTELLTRKATANPFAAVNTFPAYHQAAKDVKEVIERIPLIHHLTPANARERALVLNARKHFDEDANKIKIATFAAAQKDQGNRNHVGLYPEQKEQKERAHAAADKLVAALNALVQLPA